MSVAAVGNFLFLLFVTSFRILYNFYGFSKVPFSEMQCDWAPASANRPAARLLNLLHVEHILKFTQTRIPRICHRIADGSTLQWTLIIVGVMQLIITILYTANPRN